MQSLCQCLGCLPPSGSFQEKLQAPFSPVGYVSYKDLVSLLETAEGHITPWGGRIVTVQGYPGSVSLAEISDKVIGKISYKGPLFELNITGQGLSLIRKVKVLQKAIEGELAQKTNRQGLCHKVQSVFLKFFVSIHDFISSMRFSQGSIILKHAGDGHLLSMLYP